MDIIQDTFLHVQDLFFKAAQWEVHVQELKETDAAFRSIAYESASMSIAMEDIRQKLPLTNWLAFLNGPGAVHSTQVHVGLGWALAQLLLDPLTLLPLLSPMQRYRVLDGYGYYEGIFRRRRSIMNHMKLHLPDHVASGALDQGIGRSTWYLNKGNFDAAKLMIEGFPAERYKDLWRGLGIAIAYVGGGTEESLQQSFNKAGDFKPQLAAGTAMALISRKNAGNITDDTTLVCKIFCGKEADEIVAIDEKIKSGLDLDSDHAYVEWLDKLQLAFS